MNLRIGSGDIGALLMGAKTNGFQDLLRMFVSDKKPNYNAFASPIDACRAGAILEDRYLQILPDGYYPQYKVSSKEMDVFVATLDFAKIDSGEVVDFEELKTLNLEDFLKHVELLRGETEGAYLPVIKKTFKKYYNQIQEQLYCTELDSANLVFLSVDTYDDEVNYRRIIEPNDIIRFRIKRDERVISEIKKRGQLFQTIKDYFK